ncbi:MAG TPA: HD domain-containing protein [Chloroflexota bacterium]
MLPSKAIPTLDEARDVTRELLRHLPNRLAHSLAVGETCQQVAEHARAKPGLAGLATVAAYLHDVGYSAQLRQTGFHPIDGGRYLRSIGWDALVPFVAHHSQAFIQAELLGLSLAEFRHVRGIVQDLVDYSDVRTGPVGQRMTPDERLAEIVERHQGDTSALAVPRRRPYVQALVRRLEGRCGGDPLA